MFQYEMDSQAHPDFLASTSWLALFCLVTKFTYCFNLIFPFQIHIYHLIPLTGVIVCEVFSFQLEEERETLTSGSGHPA